MGRPPCPRPIRRGLMELSEFYSLVRSMAEDGSLVVGAMKEPPHLSLVFVNDKPVAAFNTNKAAVQWLFYTLTRNDDEVN